MIDGDVADLVVAADEPLPGVVFAAREAFIERSVIGPRVTVTSAVSPDARRSLSFTLVPASPTICFTTSGSFMSRVVWPSISRMASPALTADFSAGEPSSGVTTVS